MGAGNLGSALACYDGFLEHGFLIDAIFDKRPAQCALSVKHGLKVFGVEKIERVVRRRDIKIGIIAVPKDEAQNVVDQLVCADIRGILNFAPIRVSAPTGVWIKNVDLGSELEGIAFFLSKPSEWRT